MADRLRSASLALRRAFGGLSLELRGAAVGAVLLIASTFGPFSWVEAAMVLTGLGVLFLLYQRGVGKTFHLPEGDGTLVGIAGVWAGLLILIRLFDRPLGQNLLALVCAGILVAAGLAERARRREPPAGAEHPVDPADAPTTPIR